MKVVYHGLWDSFEDLEKDFAIKLDKKIKILYAWYGNEDYSGSAFVLFKQGRKLYEVNGSHCSCYGLEGQWDAEETTFEALMKRRYPNVDTITTLKGLIEYLNR